MLGLLEADCLDTLLSVRPAFVVCRLIGVNNRKTVTKQRSNTMSATLNITRRNTMNYAVNNSTINLLMNRNVGQAVLTSVRASPEPLTRTESMTLRELLGHIRSTAGVPTPGKKVLEDSSEPIATYSSEDYHLVAYKCGFALAKFGKRWTVVRVDGCKEYDYQFDEDYPKTEDTTPHHLDEEYFLDKPWQLRVMMEAEDQLESNNNSREGSLLSKHPEIPDNKIYMNGGHYSFESQIAAQDQWQRALETLSNRQRQTILLWKEGYNQKEIGKLLGITQTAVSQHFAHAVQKLKEYYSR